MRTAPSPPPRCRSSYRCPNGSRRRAYHSRSTLPSAPIAVPAHPIAVSAEIAAPASRCYAVFRDYEVAHAAVVPRRWFGPLEVLTGGIGAGTGVRFTMRVLGQTRLLHARVTEPEPGRMLMETLEETGAVSTFTVVALGADRARITIATMLQRGGGLRGAVERWLTRRVLPAVYREELERLRRYLAEGGPVMMPPDNGRRAG